MLSDDERAELVITLKDAEARIEAGQGIEYDSKSFKARLLRI